jgi:digeranylgeranylglycerophospholipid reductase
VIYDALIVGGGPGGLYAARQLARGGASVVVCEEHPCIGMPIHCTGVLGSETFSEFELPRDAVLNGLTTVRFVSPAGLEVRYTPPTEQAVVLDRALFDRQLGEQAVAAGAEVRLSTRVIELEVDSDGVSAIAGGNHLRARLVILACGASYPLQRRFGLGVPSSFLHTAQREVPARMLDDVEIHFGAAVAPGGFAWAVPVERPDGPHVRIGVMATHGAPGWYQAMSERIADRWGIESDATPPRLKFLPLGPIDRTYGDRLLVVGDAAGLVKPTTGGGIYYSIVSASFAARAAIDALARDRLDSASLSIYERRWRAHLDTELAAQRALRHAADAMVDADIDALFDLAKVDGIMPLVRRTARFNQHRHLIKALFKHPPARAVLFRALTR